jgi:hypothetical protein
MRSLRTATTALHCAFARLGKGFYLLAAWCLLASWTAPAMAVIVNGNIDTDIRPAVWLQYSGATGSANQTVAVGIFDSGDPSDTLSRETASTLTLPPVTPINPAAGLIARYQNQGTTASQNISSSGWLGATWNPPDRPSVAVGATDPAIRAGDPGHVFNNAVVANTAGVTSNGIRPWYTDYNTRNSENHTSMTFVSRANPADNLAVMVDPINGTPLPFFYDETTRADGNGRGLRDPDANLDERTSSVSYYANNNARVPTPANNTNPGFVSFVDLIPIDFATNLLPAPGASAAAVIGTSVRNTITVSNADGPNVAGLGVDYTFGLNNGWEPFYRPRDAAGTSFPAFNVAHQVANANQIRGGQVNANGFVLASGNVRVIVNQTDGTNRVDMTFPLPDQAPRPFVSIGGTNYLIDTGAPGTSVPTALFNSGTATADPDVRILPTFNITTQSGGTLTINNLAVTDANGRTPIVGTDVTNQFGQIWNFSPKGGATNPNRGTLALYAPSDPRVIALRDNGITFTVDSATLGLAATAVNHEKLYGAVPQLQPNAPTMTIAGANAGNEAAGTVFRTHLTASNATYIDELAMGLDPRRRNVVIDGQTLGKDEINIEADLFFSVSRDSVGFPGSDTLVQRQRNQAAGDIFEIPTGQASTSRLINRTNKLFLNQEVLGLGPNYGPLVTATNGPGNPSDNLLDFDLDTARAMVPTAMSNLDSPILLTNDAGNINRARVGGDRYKTNFDNYFSTGDSANAGEGARIFRSDVGNIFANAADMGLFDTAGQTELDDVDALALYRPSVGPGMIGGSLLKGPNISPDLQQNFALGGAFDSNPGRDFKGIDMFHGGSATDLALFSLAPGSQALNYFGLSPADIFITDFDGTFALWASAESLGLFFNDNVDGLDSIAAIPEPAALMLALVGMLSLGWRRQRERRLAA